MKKGDIRSFFQKPGNAGQSSQTKGKRRRESSSGTLDEDLSQDGNANNSHGKKPRIQNSTISSQIEANLQIRSAKKSSQSNEQKKTQFQPQSQQDSEPMEIIEHIAVEDSSEGELLTKAASASHYQNYNVPPQHIVETDPLFVEKYRPQIIQDIIGNETVVANLARWLQNWEAVHIRGEAPKTATGRVSKKADSHKKAALLSGLPGIGKTTAAHVVPKSQNYVVTEINASLSCASSTKDIRKGIGNRALNRVLEQCSNTLVDGSNVKQVIVIDEIDGISDRGAVVCVKDMINKSTKVPIICICNDKFVQKLKSLRESCTEFDFYQPRREQVVKRIQEICQSENIQIDAGGVDVLYGKSNGDMRMIMGWIQTFNGLNVQYVLNRERVEELMMSSWKDSSVSPFEAARKLLDVHSDCNRIDDKLDLVMSDLDLLPLLVQENYLSFNPTLSRGNPKLRLKCCVKAAHAMSLGEIMSGVMRKTGNWSLYPVVGMIGGVYASTYVRGNREAMTHVYDSGRINFPIWFGKNSTTKKNKRLENLLYQKLVAAGMDIPDVSTLGEDYLPFLMDILVKPIAAFIRQGKIKEGIELMQQYCLSREDLDFIIDISNFKRSVDPFEGIPSTSKAAFTRELNKIGLVPKAAFMAPEAVLKSTKGKKSGTGTSKKKESKKKIVKDNDGEDGFGDPDVIKEDKFVVDSDEDDEADQKESLDSLLEDQSLQLELKGGTKRGGKAGASKSKTSPCGRGRTSTAGRKASSRGRGKK